MSRGSCSRPSSASRRSTSCASSRPTSAAASARRSSSMPRRPSAPGRPRRSTGRSNGRRTAPKRSCPTRTAAITSPMPNSRSTRAARSPACGSHTIANLGAYLSTFASSVPTYLYAPLLSGQYNIPAIYAEVDAVYTTTAPVDAYRGAGRPEATFVVERLVEIAARETRARPGRVPPAELRHRSSRTRRRSSWPMTSGDYAGALDKALALADYKGVGARKAASAAKGKLRGVGFSALSRPAASRRRRRSARSAPASACGNRPKCASIRSARSRC